MLEHVAPLVDATALNADLLAEGVADRSLKRLRAVDHDEQALVGRESAIAQVGEGPAANRLVLSRPLPDPEWVLAALGVDPERDDAGVLGDRDPVEHQHD